MNNYELITFKNGECEMKILFSNNDKTVWLTVAQISELFDTTRQTVSKHLKAISDKRIQQGEGKLETLNINQQEFNIIFNINPKRTPLLYNLQVVMELGESLNLDNAITLKEYIESYITELDDNMVIEGNEIITYSNKNVNINVNLSRKEETIWLSQKQICSLYQTSKSNISEHISNILLDKELDVNSVVRNFRTTQSDGKSYDLYYYNLDMVLAIGYRVRSSKAIEFRRWATEKLKEYIYTGQVISDNASLTIRDELCHLYDFVKEINKRLTEVEKDKRKDTLDKIIVEDTRFDALVMFDSIISKAEEIVILIDRYVDLSTLDMLKNKKREAKLVIVTSSYHYKLSDKEVEIFNEQYGGLIVKFDNKVHDRYLVIDHKRYFHLGASMNYFGKYLTQITEETNIEVISELKKRIETYNI